MTTSSQTISVAGGTLFQVAATYLGDPTQWNRIAKLNGLIDPWLPSGVTTLAIPAVDPRAGNGGIRV